jgi:4-aminobutyrate aminotransferase-like enzyme
MDPLEVARAAAAQYLERAALLQARYRKDEIRTRMPPGFLDADRPLVELVAAGFPTSHAVLEAASNGLFYSLPIAFDPGQSVGLYLAAADRDAEGEPYRFLDMGAQIATQPFGENDLGIAAAVLRELPFLVSRYAHSEYQTGLSLRLKAALDGLAPRGTPRHFVVNTGAEAVENAIKALLLHRVMTRKPPPEAGVEAVERLGLFVVSFDGAFHGRTLGSLAVTHRRRARLGFPTFDWPQVAPSLSRTRGPLRGRGVATRRAWSRSGISWSPGGSRGRPGPRNSSSGSSRRAKA